MARILITGALGFAGRTLIKLLSSDTDEIYAAYLNSEPPAGDDPVRGHCRLMAIDILRPAQVAASIEEIRPEHIYHLAALVPINVSLITPARTMDVNVIGTVNLLEAVRTSSCRPRILMPGSSEEFGLIHPHETPVTEEQPLRPTNPCGVSKAAQTLLGMQYVRTYGLAVIGARPFNMTGPGQSTDYACPSFARQIAMIEAGRSEPVVRVGNLSARRDFSDVRDVMRACILLMKHGRPGETYNICSGRAYGMREVLDKLLALSPATIEVRDDPSKHRPAENLLVLGSNRKLVEATGYQPHYSLEQTLSDVLADFRTQLAVESSQQPRTAMATKSP